MRARRRTWLAWTRPWGRSARRRRPRGAAPTPAALVGRQSSSDRERVAWSTPVRGRARRGPVRTQLPRGYVAWLLRLCGVIGRAGEGVPILDPPAQVGPYARWACNGWGALP